MKILLSFLILTCIIDFKPVKAQWTYIPIGYFFKLESIYFTSLDTGYVTVEGYVGKTIDAGSTWVPVFSFNSWYRSVYFVNAMTGFVAASDVGSNTGYIFRTTTAGLTWNSTNLPTAPRFTTVYFINQNIGYVSGFEVMLKTTNGGDNWESQNINVNGYLFGIYFTDDNTGYVVGDGGDIFKTTNGGSSWDLLNSTTTIDLYGISFANSNTGFAVGGNDTSPSENIILKTMDAGNTWSQVIFDTYSDSLLWSVRFINSSTGYITGDGSNIAKTTNGGINWYNQTCPVPGQVIRNSFFINNDTGYICAYNGTIGSIILKTTDGGEEVTAVNQNVNEVPREYTLLQNYPNPFNPNTVIKYTLPKKTHVKLSVFDVLGEEVAVLANEVKQAGRYEEKFDASRFASGTYFYKLTAGDFTQTKKMMLVK
jgi:photosystem II stability/assembly factor-like uncharacterized protein